VGVLHVLELLSWHRLTPAATLQLQLLLLLTLCDCDRFLRSALHPAGWVAHGEDDGTLTMLRHG
jgi:hypothetical protein